MEAMFVLADFSHLGMIESDSLFPTIFHCRTHVFSTVGAEMLTGGSVGVGWDQLERSGPKEVRQVTTFTCTKGLPFLVRLSAYIVNL